MLLICGCFNPEDPDTPFITGTQWKLIKAFVLENNYPESSDLDDFVQYLYKEWPDDDEIRDFILTFPVQDTMPRTLILSDVLTKIGKTLRVYHSPSSGGVYPAYIDSIEIRTDSVIIIPSLSLEDCHLTHLPPQIGKIRTRVLDIGWNKGLVLPIEITQMDSLPQPYDSLSVRSDQTWTQASFDSLPEWTKEWLSTHNLGFLKFH